MTKDSWTKRAAKINAMLYAGLTITYMLIIGGLAVASVGEMPPAPTPYPWSIVSTALAVMGFPAWSAYQCGRYLERYKASR